MHVQLAFLGVATLSIRAPTYTNFSLHLTGQTRTESGGRLTVSQEYPIVMSCVLHVENAPEERRILFGMFGGKDREMRM